jgi:hypothetical protein
MNRHDPLASSTTCDNDRTPLRVWCGASSRLKRKTIREFDFSLCLMIMLEVLNWVLDGTRNLKRYYQLVLKKKCVRREQRVFFRSWMFLRYQFSPMWQAGGIHIIGMDGVLRIETEICSTIKGACIFRLSHKLLRGVDLLSVITHEYRCLASNARL